MKRLGITFALAVASLIINGGASCLASGRSWVHVEEPTAPIVISGLPQFGKLNEHVWRSGQPERDGYQRLMAMGLKTVIDLRSEGGDSVGKHLKGVRFYHIPVHDNRPPTDQQAAQVLRIVSNPNNWPVVIHCDAGEGRVGVMTAVIRWSLDGWDDARIMRELKNYQVRHFGVAKLPLGASERHFIKQWELKNTPGKWSA